MVRTKIRTPPTIPPRGPHLPPPPLPPHLPLLVVAVDRGRGGTAGFHIQGPLRRPDTPPVHHEGRIACNASTSLPPTVLRRLPPPPNCRPSRPRSAGHRRPPQRRALWMFNFVHPLPKQFQRTQNNFQLCEPKPIKPRPMFSSNTNCQAVNK